MPGLRCLVPGARLQRLGSGGSLRLVPASAVCGKNRRLSGKRESALLKLYGKPDDAGPDWYGPPKVIETVPTAVRGNPDLAHICTGHVERSNLNFRMHLRRFTRLVNAFSKKLENLKAAVALYVAWYNFCRVHVTLRVTPAMEAGIADHVWEMRELLA